jgi:hypothetical protein
MGLRPVLPGSWGTWPPPQPKSPTAAVLTGTVCVPE